MDAYTGLKHGFQRFGDTIKMNTDYAHVTSNKYNGFVLALVTHMIKSVDFPVVNKAFQPNRIFAGAGNFIFDVDLNLPATRQKNRTVLKTATNHYLPNETNTGFRDEEELKLY
jgi:uncharacterized membrane protein